MPGTVLDPMFQHVTATEFTEQHLASLLAGTCAAVGIPASWIRRHASAW